ncbi:MAG: hypothetical protein LBH76_05395, partial [Propionibacteriaceae bacterium]|nr:hypothetical protein [Propionibacteriaceae bacterium]
RAYTGEPLRPEHLADLTGFIATTEPPFGVEAQIALVHADLGAAPQKLGSYGMVKNARDFMGLVYADGPLAAAGAAYWFEQAVLRCTALGVGTCWLAGFTHGSFSRQLTLAAGEKLRIASPLGYPGGPKPLAQRLGLFDPDKLHRNKKPFEKLVLRPDFATPVTAAEAGPLAEPLELTRLAPSAQNLQPYTLILDAGAVHFYAHRSQFSEIDTGIALAHFDLSAAALGLAGALAVLDAPPADPRPGPGAAYVMSWRRA